MSTAAPARSAAPSFRTELRDAVSARTVTLVIGVLLLQLTFIASYVGAFHAPTPHAVPVQVVAPTQVSQQLVGSLNALDDEPVDARAATSEASARADLQAGRTSGVLVVDPTGTEDRLLVASGGGVSVASAVEQVFTQVEAAQDRTVTVDDVVPLEESDGRGLTGFYLVIGWIVGGYLVAALLGVAKGSRPANLRRALIRLLATVPYAMLSGIGGALVVDQLLGALTGHFWALAGLGTLLVLAAAASTMAFQVLFGVLGIGLTVLVFVVLGNPSAGGAYQPELLPGFWRGIGPWLPNGAGTDAVRQVVYFGGHDVLQDLLVVCAYVVGGAVLALAGAHWHQRRAEAAEEAGAPRHDAGVQGRHVRAEVVGS